MLGYTHGIPVNTDTYLLKNEKGLDSIFSCMHLSLHCSEIMRDSFCFHSFIQNLICTQKSIVIITKHFEV